MECWSSGVSQKFATYFPRHSAKNLPFPSFPKRGLSPTEEIPPLKKGDSGGFECGLLPPPSFGFFNELLGHHTRFVASLAYVPPPRVYVVRICQISPCVKYLF